MIVVFVVDTSPSMGEPVVMGGSSQERSRGMSRLDLAKMAVESLAKGLRKRVVEHNVQLQQQTGVMQKSFHNLGLGYCPNDQFLLLSTGRQQSGTAACGAGGRLLVGYGDSVDFSAEHAGDTPPLHGNHGSFDRSLKHLQATDYQLSSASMEPRRVPFPEDGGGAVGLNAALSAGLQLLSRYRLQNRTTENFGLGRLPSPAMLAPSGGGAAVNALQPACVILLTDGECLRKSPSEGGGSLQLQTGNLPLKEFYQEPFRWDQRIFCLGVGAPDGVTSSQYLDPTLRALCEVTGGSHAMLRSVTSLSQVTDSLLKLIAPPRPREIPIPDPLRPLAAPSTPASQSRVLTGLFVNGGPICCFQSLEGGANGEQSPTRRAMLLYVPFEQANGVSSAGAGNSQPPMAPPMWCIPESFFPSKKLDVLPPRLAQPLLSFSENYSMVGSKLFDPGVVMKLLQRLDQLTLVNRKISPSTGAQAHAKLLQRDVYICEWLSQDGKSGGPPRGSRGMEYLPVCVRGAGRPLVDGDEHYLSIGILHVPPVISTLSQPSSGARFTTLTLLPPEPHILLPLLVKAAEAEHRLLRKSSDTKDVPNRAGTSAGATAGLIQMQAGTSSTGPKVVNLDEHWRSDFRAYMFRIPPYYHNALKRCLRPILPASVHSLLNMDGIETLASLCFSKACLQKIRNGELVARETNERLERQEAELRRRGVQTAEIGNKGRQTNTEITKSSHHIIGYGQYDPRASTTSFLAALRTMPAPWKVGVAPKTKEKDISVVESCSQDGVSETTSIASLKEGTAKTVVDILGDLPVDCLIPYYESRRRWIFGGSGLTTRGLHAEGVRNDGSNAHYYEAHHDTENESILSFAGVGVSTLNKTTTAEMGNYRERLLWSRAPMVGYGSNDAAGVSATTAPDGSPAWSVDDDVMPMSYFDLKTGEFADSVETRVRSRLMVNFGNPYKDKRGDAIVPEAFLNQSPSFNRSESNPDNGPLTPPGSPPHDAFTSTEGEGEAVFAEQPIRKLHSRHHANAEPSKKHEAVDVKTDGKRPREDDASKGATAPEVNTPSTPRKKAKTIPDPPPSKASAEGAVQRPPPPPNPPQKKKAPPPPPRPPPPPPAEKHPQAKEGGAVKESTGAIDLSVPKPEVAEATGTSTEQTRPTEKQAQPLDLQNPDSKPNVKLPSNWICAWSKSQKRWYFFDIKTNKSIWQWPPPGGL